MAKLGLALNETKTAIRDARREHFDFPGLQLRPHHYRKDGHWYLGASPSKKSVLRLKAKASDTFSPPSCNSTVTVRPGRIGVAAAFSSFWQAGKVNSEARMMIIPVAKGS